MHRPTGRAVLHFRDGQFGDLTSLEKLSMSTLVDQLKALGYAPTQVGSLVMLTDRCGRSLSVDRIVDNRPIHVRTVSKQRHRGEVFVAAYLLGLWQGLHQLPLQGRVVPEGFIEERLTFYREVLNDHGERPKGTDHSGN